MSNLYDTGIVIVEAVEVEEKPNAVCLILDKADGSVIQPQELLDAVADWLLEFYPNMLRLKPDGSGH